MNLHALTRSPRRGVPSIVGGVATLAGAALVVGSSYIHFHLWQNGYRNIPTVGVLFVIQSVAGVVIAVLAVLARRAWSAIVGAGFALSTIAGFLVSVNVGLFGFRDSSSSPYAHLALVVEVLAVLAFTLASVLCLSNARVSTSGERERG